MNYIIQRNVQITFIIYTYDYNKNKAFERTMPEITDIIMNIIWSLIWILYICDAFDVHFIEYDVTNVSNDVMTIQTKDFDISSPSTNDFV